MLSARCSVGGRIIGEVAPFGIKVTLVEPGGYSTDWGGSSAQWATLLPAYDALREEVTQRQAANVAKRGDPRATREAPS